MGTVVVRKGVVMVEARMMRGDWSERMVMGVSEKIEMVWEEVRIVMVGGREREW